MAATRVVLGVVVLSPRVVLCLKFCFDGCLVVLFGGCADVFLMCCICFLPLSHCFVLYLCYLFLYGRAVVFVCFLVCWLCCVAHMLTGFVYFVMRACFVCVCFCIIDLLVVAFAAVVHIVALVCVCCVQVYFVAVV